MTAAVGTGNTAPGVTTVCALCFTWAILTYIVRAWVKLRKSDVWATDDTVISLALGAILIHVACTLKAVDNRFGEPWSTINPTQEAASKYLYVAQIFYILSVGLIRASGAFFNARLTGDRGNIALARGAIAACGIWTFVSILAVAIRAPYDHPWTTRDGTYPMYVRWMGIEVAGSALELCVWGICTYFVCSLHMPLAKKFWVSMIFACRLVIIPFSVLRIITLSPSYNPDPDFPPLMAYIYTEVAVDFAFMAASATCLKPFVKPFHSGYFVSSARSARRSKLQTHTKSSRGDSYYMLSAARSIITNKADAVISTQKADSEAQPTVAMPVPSFRPDKATSRAIVETNERDDEPNNDTSQQMIISMTTEWGVTYEEGSSSKLRRGQAI